VDGYTISHSHRHGYGLVDAERAVTLAESWVSRGVALATGDAYPTTTNDILQYDSNFDPVAEIAPSSTIKISEDFQVESVEILFAGEGHPAWGDLEIKLMSPDGTVSTLTAAHDASYKVADQVENLSWWFSSMRHWGEGSQGDWQLWVVDKRDNHKVGEFVEWEIKVHGTPWPDAVNTPTATLQVLDATASEDGNAGRIAVQLDRASSQDTMVTYTVEGNEDIAPLTDSVVVKAGEQFATFGIAALHDYAAEGEESVVITLSEGTGYALGSAIAGTVVIEDSAETFRYGPFVYEFGGKQYLLSQPDTWHGAQSQAQALGGNLVSIGNQTENNWLLETFPKNAKFWIGITDSKFYNKTEGDFGWVDGESLTFTNWRPGEPNNGGTGENFAELYNYSDVLGLWNDTPAENSGGQILSGLIEIDPDDLSKPIVNMMVTDAEAGEDGNAGQIVFTRVGDISQALTVEYAVDGSANNGTDYRSLSGFVTFAPGQLVATVGITPLADFEDENSENVVLTLKDTGAYTLGLHREGQVSIEPVHPVNQISREIIGRELQQFDSWKADFDNGESPESLRRRIIDMARDSQGIIYQIETKINEAYQQALGRNATAEEIADWRSQIENGKTLSDVSQSLVGVVVPIDTLNPVYKNPVTGNFYFLTTPDTWLGAQEQAEAAGGNLVTINDWNEERWIEKNLLDPDVIALFGLNYWIGLNDSEIYGNREGDFRWVNSESLDYTPWSWSFYNDLSDGNNWGVEDKDFSYVEFAFFAPGWYNTSSQLFNSPDTPLLQGIVEIPSTLSEASFDWAWTYFGEDLNPGGNATRLTETPNLDNARNQFLANLSSYDVQDFEGFNHADKPATLAIGSENATLEGGVPVQKLETGTLGNQGVYPLSGDNYLFHWNALNQFTLTFENPQTAFGFSATDMGDAGEQMLLEVKYADGNTETMSVPHQLGGNPGAANFFGFVDADNPFQAITFIGTKPEEASWGLDDFILGQVSQEAQNRTAATPPNRTFHQTYRENQTLDLVDIEVTAPSSAADVFLQLSNPAAGALSVGTSGTVTSSYDAATGLWKASGNVADVNALLAEVAFTPTDGFTQNVQIKTFVVSGSAEPLTGTIALRGVAAPNIAPELNTVQTFTDATQYQTKTITYADLLAASDATDANGDAISFRIEGVGDGVLTLNGEAVTVGQTVVRPGDELQWVSNLAGNDVLGFQVSAVDALGAASERVDVAFDITELDFTPVKVAQEFQVNDYVNDEQTVSSISTFDNGDFLVVWQSWGQDGSNWGIYGQRFTSDGQSIGDEFRVNSTTEGIQFNSSIKVLSDQSYIVTWASEDINSLGVYGQKFDKDNKKIGGEFQINSYTDNYQTDPQIASLKEGKYVVVWTSQGQDGSFSGIYGQIYDETNQRIGDEFQVHTTTDFYQGNASITNLEEGFVVTWISQQPDQGNKTDSIYLQFYDVNFSKFGQELEITSDSPGSEYYDLSVSSLNNGNFLVTYNRDLNNSHGRIFDRDGNQIGEEFIVNSTLGSARATSSHSLDDGGFLITWQSWEQDGSSWGVYGQRYSFEGDKVGNEFQINSHVERGQMWPQTVSLGGGEFIVTWDSYDQDGSDVGIFAQRFTLPDLPHNQTTHYRPSTPYTTPTNSPFQTANLDPFHIEDFQDNLINGPALTIQNHTNANIISGGLAQEDNLINGNKALQVNNTELILDFAQDFTHVGLVITDIDPGSTATIEAFDRQGVSLGQSDTQTFSNATDEFLGISNNKGIASVTISTNDANGWEVDHIQYG
jgi:subtilisin-like proprotein convertase family protein